MISNETRINLRLMRAERLFAQARPGHSLPQAFYNDNEIFQFDLDAIYTQCWLLIGFTCELPYLNTYLAATVGRSQILVTRDSGDVVRAFYNCCRHRGAQICPVGRGQTVRLVCPYHQWSYGLNGSIIGATPKNSKCASTELSLRPVHIEVVAGAIFVCLSERRPPPFGRFRRELATLLECHNLHNAKVAHEYSLKVEANWKLVMENARECYHCGVGHPELSRLIPKSQKFTRSANSPCDHVGNAAPEDRASLHKSREAKSGPYRGSWWEIEQFALANGQKSFTSDGEYAVKKLLVENEDVLSGSLRWAVEPHSFCHSTADMTFYFSAMPVSATETAIECKWLVHKDAAEGVDYHLDNLIFIWDVTNRQDINLIENNQRGINSKGYIPGPYNEFEEAGLVRFMEFYQNTASRFISNYRAIHAS